VIVNTSLFKNNPEKVREFIVEFYKTLSIPKAYYESEIQEPKFSKKIKSKTPIILLQGVTPEQHERITLFDNIGRNVNFRSTDPSSPFFYKLEKKYLKRLNKKDKVYAYNEILKKNPIVISNIHYIFGYSKLLLNAFDKRLSMYILMLRDPFYLIDKWHKGNWPIRRAKDILDFGLCIKFKNKIIPWYAKEYATKYIKANNFEKSILTVYEYYKHVFQMFKNLKKKERKKMQLIFFEDFVNFPQKYNQKLFEKLKLGKEKNFNKILTKLVPKQKYSCVTTFNFFNKKYSKIISPRYKKIIIELNNKYLDFFKKNSLLLNKNTKN
jgi:hypothetical protein